MDALDIYLSEAFERDGCPVCTLLRNFEEKTLTTLLYEHPNDPSLIEELKKGLGLCTYHSWKALELTSKNPLIDPLSIAVIYERMLDHYLRNWDNADGNRCMICTMSREKEETLIDAIADRMKELLNRYEESPAILCRKHFQMLLERTKKLDKKHAARLEAIQKLKGEKLQRLLKAFIEKSSYLHDEGPTEEEILSIRQTILLLKGEPLPINQESFLGAESRGRSPWKRRLSFRFQGKNSKG